MAQFRLSGLKGRYVLGTDTPTGTVCYDTYDRTFCVYNSNKCRFYNIASSIEEEFHAALKKACRPFTTVETDYQNHDRPKLSQILVTTHYDNIIKFEIVMEPERPTKKKIDAETREKYESMELFGIFLSKPI